MLEHVEHGVGVAVVLHGRIDVHAAVADREADRRVVGFVPPAVERRAVERAVEHGLHAAGAAGFEGTPRNVQPQVAAGEQQAADALAVAFDEDHAVLEAVVAARARARRGSRAWPARRPDGPCRR